MVDTEGNRIQAHGGAIFFENGLYYWYGEDKSKTTGKNKIWSWGVRYYSSKDFYNWKDEGHLIFPNENDKKSILHPAAHQLDRPHIIYNASTGKYVCWLKFSGKKDACFAVMTADRLPGPYRMVKEYFRPFGKEVGDFDLYQDEATGKTYLYFASGREGVVACTLSDNGTDVEGEYKMYYTGLKPPFCREGITIVSHEGRLFMLSSGMTGYVPNPSQYAELQSPLGEITEIGNPHKNDNSGASFNSQISAAFHHPKHPGYKTFNIAPLVGGRLTNAKGSVKTPYGKIVSDWKIEGDTFKIKIQVPVSTTCHLILPNGEGKDLGSGEYEFKSCRK
jgi:hypothetical protein